MDITHAGKFNTPIELASLEEIAAMNRQCEEATNTLEFFRKSVKCQKCGYPKVRDLQKLFFWIVIVWAKLLGLFQMWH